MVCINDRPTRVFWSSWLWAATLLAMACGAQAESQRGPERWEPQIAAFEKQDQEQAPPRNGILFVGSSSIRGWKLEEYFAELPVINRGFGGSQIADSVHFADRIVIPHQPRIVVLYAGDNDIAKGKNPQQVAADYREFVRTIHAALPRTSIVFISIKPSLRRWEMVEKMRRANALIQAFSDKDERLRYVGIDAPMIGEDGTPRKELFKSDGLHLNAAGYQLWADALRPHLEIEP
jgi:lysophospholipase L1-like esterase